MALHIFRRQDDALSRLTSRYIYSIDSLESILWILWPLLFSLHVFQSVINFRGVFAMHHCHLVLYETASEAWFLQKQKKDFFFFFQHIVGAWNIRKTIIDFCAKRLQPHGLKTKNEKKEKVHIYTMEERSEDRGWRKYFFKEKSLSSVYCCIWTSVWIDTPLNIQPLLKVRDEKCFVLIFGYITVWILQLFKLKTLLGICCQCWIILTVEK